MNVCPQCGNQTQPTNKFCNFCGFALKKVEPSGSLAYADTGAAPPGYGVPQNTPPPYGSPPGVPQPPYGVPPPAPIAAPARCAYGHDAAAGANYCPGGHPVVVAPVIQSAGAMAAFAPTDPAPARSGPPVGVPAMVGTNNLPTDVSPMSVPEQLAFLCGFLVSFESSMSGEFWPLRAGRETVGRADSGEQVDIALVHPTISSRHAAFIVDGVKRIISVEDTGSTNGTYVNDEPVAPNVRRELKDGDRVRFGGFTTVVKVIGRISNS